MIDRLRFPAPRGALLVLTLCASQAWSQNSAPAELMTYKLDPAKSSLTFNFVQAGADSKGRFGKLDATLVLSDANLPASKLEVTVDVASVNTEDKERDDTLRSADLFNVAKFPQAKFVSSSISKTANGYEAAGKLTIRDVTRDVRIPFTFQTASEGGRPAATMAGKFTIKRLDYGVGQGEWKSTEWVANDVTVTFNLRLVAPSG